MAVHLPEPLVTVCPSPAGYLGLYVFYVVTVIICTWVYQRQRSRSLVHSISETPGEEPPRGDRGDGWLCSLLLLCVPQGQSMSCPAISSPCPGPRPFPGLCWPAAEPSCPGSHTCLHSIPQLASLVQVVCPSALGKNPDKPYGHMYRAQVH